MTTMAERDDDHPDDRASGDEDAFVLDLDETGDAAAVAAEALQEIGRAHV